MYNKTSKKKNKTKKQRQNINGGGANWTIIGDKIKDYAGNIIGYVTNKGLRFFGVQLKPVKTDASGKPDPLSESLDKGLDKTSQLATGELNDLLNSKRFNNSVSKNMESGEKVMDGLNETLENPVFQDKTNKTIENVAKISEKVIKAIDKPLDKAIDKISDSATKAASGATAGLVKVGTDAMAAVPGVGAIMELGKIANDVSNSVSSVTGAASDASKSISTMVKETKENLNELEKKQEEGEKILNRANNSIDKFNSSNNLQIPATEAQTAGRRKTFKKRKGKNKSYKISKF
jgi:uncharacterized protein Yka (UPF0111/DUF47 family)